jgi:RND family efflux transporter MFP subunit
MMPRVIAVGMLVLMSVTAQAASFEARVTFARKTELGFAVSGVVQRVDVAPGSQVKKGQSLLALEDTPFKAEVDQAAAEVARRNADQAEAVRDYKQAKELFDRTVLSVVELENAKLKAQRADAALREARARLAAARYALERSAINAPFDAVVLEVRVQPGQSMVSRLEAKPAIVLAALGEYLARGSVSGSRIEGLQVGQAASVLVGGNRYSGRVHSFGLEPQAPGGSEHDISVVFSSGAAVLRAGQSASVELQR